MWFLLAVAGALIFGVGGFLIKFSDHRGGSPLHLMVGIYTTGTLACAVGATMDGAWGFSGGLLLGGLAIAAGSALGNLHFVRALKYGPASLTSPLVNLNVALVVILSIVVYGEQLTWLEAGGVILVTAAVLLLPVDPHESLGIRNRRWYLLVALAILFFALRNGGLKVTEEAGLNNGAVLFYGYLIALLGFGVALGVNRRGNRPVHGSPRVGLAFGLVIGVTSYLGLRLYAGALATGPASIVSPIFATNSLVVSMLSIALLRERLSPLQTTALATLFAGMILLRIG